MLTKKLCVVPLDTIINSPNPDMATLFFDAAFGNPKVTKAMQVLVAFSILGNSRNPQLTAATNVAVIVMTFTASRVKQELAKEGILPWSLVFSTGRATATSWLRARFRRSHYHAPPTSEKLGDAPPQVDPLQQTPVAALGLQWLSSLVLLAVTAKLTVNYQYSFITNLYTYVMVILVAFCTTTGLLYCKYIRRDWASEFKPWGGPVPAVVFW